MNTTFKFIIAAMAAGAVLSSCQKEMAIDNTASSTDGVRVISASFSAPTKSTLDGNTPKFVGGETIKVSNATESQVRTISIDASGNPYFSTSLTGTLTAVYPSTAAKMNGDIIDQTAVLVSTVQDGTFAGANIAMATGITTSATFTNKTAVIAITPGAGSNSNYVEVITAGPEIANDAPTGSAFSKYNKIHVNVNSATTYPVYVSILVPSGLKVKNLSFADGKNIKTAKNNDTDIAVNTINTVSGETSTWNTPYVEINGLKWATENIGATATNPNGHYFAWGYAEGCVRNTASNGWVLASDNTTAKQFNTEDFPNRDASSFQDAATANWGGSWRMPTGDDSGEFVALINATYWQWDETDRGCYVYAPYEGDEGKKDNEKGEGHSYSKYDCLLFFPLTGMGDGDELKDGTTKAYYWSKSESRDLYINININGNKINNLIGKAGSQKNKGFSVRAVSD